MYPLHLKISRCFVGVKHGLQLVVNVEQYDYTEGPHSAVGLKLLLHRQGDVPLVNDFGDNVPTGIHTFVALSVSKESVIVFLPNKANCLRNVLIYIYSLLFLSGHRATRSFLHLVRSCSMCLVPIQVVSITARYSLNSLCLPSSLSITTFRHTLSLLER